jgi:hypothetical protein
VGDNSSDRDLLVELKTLVKTQSEATDKFRVELKETLTQMRSNHEALEQRFNAHVTEYRIKVATIEAVASGRLSIWQAGMSIVVAILAMFGIFEGVTKVFNFFSTR